MARPPQIFDQNQAGPTKYFDLAESFEPVGRTVYKEAILKIINFYHDKFDLIENVEFKAGTIFISVLTRVSIVYENTCIKLFYEFSNRRIYERSFSFTIFAYYTKYFNVKYKTQVALKNQFYAFSVFKKGLTLKHVEKYLYHNNCVHF